MERRNNAKDVDFERNLMTHWKSYTIIALETLLAFCLATFSLGIFITHFDHNWFFAIIMLLLYFSVIGICITRIINQYSIAAIMLLIPIAPLAILLTIIALIPLLQRLQ